MPLEGRVAVVTGASRGIGRAVALRLAREGARVEAVARTEEALRELAGSGERITARRADVAREDAVRDVVQAVLRDRGRIDVLVNNAGLGVFAPIEETSWDDFLRVLRVNAGGTFLFSRAVLPGMKRQRSGEIINISSVVGIKGYPRQTAYGASKHAVMGLTKALAAEVQEHGVRVRSICPGGVDTGLVAQARPDLDRTALMRPEDIADIVLWLLTTSPTAVVDHVQVRRPGSAPWF